MDIPSAPSRPPPMQWDTADAEIKDPYGGKPELKGSLLSLDRAGPYIAMHATTTAKDSSLLISTLLVHSPLFYPNHSRAFPVLAVANTGSYVGPQNKIGHPAHRCRKLMQNARGI